MKRWIAYKLIALANMLSHWAWKISPHKHKVYYFTPTVTVEWSQQQEPDKW